MPNHKTLLATAALMAVGAFVFQLILQDSMRHYAVAGIYFQGWSSEGFTQTVPIQSLRDQPVQSLLNIHIEPPGLDLIRAILVQFSPSKELAAALQDVDLRLEVLWALVYSLAGALIFYWTAQLTRTWVAVAVAAVYLLHPGTIFYTTLLDATILTNFLILCLFYLLWKTARGDHRAIPALAGVTLALFFTKSLFQLPLILLIGLCLYLLKVPRRGLQLFLLVTLGASLLYTVKQFAMFHIFSTSSFAGYNFCKSIGIDNHYAVRLNLDGRDTTGLPEVLAAKTKLTGGINYNNINFLDFSDYLLKKYIKYMLKLPVSDLARNYLDNLRLYWLPSSHYAREVNVIVEHLPYRSAFDLVFSYPVFPAVLVLAGLYALAATIRGRTYASSAALLLPALAIFVISVIGDKGENMRYKFFLEPVYMIFIVAQVQGALRQLRARRGSHTGAPVAEASV